MNRLVTLACCLCLLALSAPALQAAEAEAPDAAPVAELATPVPPEAAVGPAPEATPMTSCSEPYHGGHTNSPPSLGGDPERDCADVCAESGGTFHSYFDLGRYVYLCYCCPG